MKSIKELKAGLQSIKPDNIDDFPEDAKIYKSLENAIDELEAKRKAAE